MVLEIVPADTVVFLDDAPGTAVVFNHVGTTYRLADLLIFLDTLFSLLG